MSDTIKIRNKITGEIMTIKKSMPKPEITQEPVATGKKSILPTVEQSKKTATDIQSDIAKRGDYLNEIAANMESGAIGRKALGVLQTAGIPLVAASGAISNPALAMQQGNFNPKQLAQEAIKGIALQKQGKIGDVYRGGGMEKNLAGIAGFGVEMLAPSSAIAKMNKYFGKLTTAADKVVNKAGTKIVQAVDQGLKVGADKLNAVFSKVDNLPVDGNEVLKLMDNLPENIVARIDKEVPELAQSVGNLTVGGLRKIKQYLGKYAPAKFGKGEKGAVENLADQDYSEAYGKIANLLHDTVRKVAGKSADEIIKAEKFYSDMANAGRYLTRKVTDSSTRLVSKTGKLAKDITSPLDATPRMAMDLVKNAGGNNRALVTSAEMAMDAFNRQQMIQELLKHAGSAALFGGAVGGLGGYLGQKVYGDKDRG